MNDFYTSETPTNQTNKMPTHYSATRQRTLAAKHLSGHDDDPDSIYKDALIIQIFQHWRIKTLEHQHNEKNHLNNAHFSQALQGETSSSIVKDESTGVQLKPPLTLQKRVTPPPTSYLRRKENLKRHNSAPTDHFDPKYLAPNVTKAKSTTGSISSTKKTTKSNQVFIEPKKTQQSPLPRPFALPSFDESLAIKPKFFAEKSTNNSIPFAHSDDDETSDQEIRQESLYIRRKVAVPKRPRTTNFVSHEHLHIPAAIFVTNPQGHCQTFDLESESLKETTNLQHSVTIPSLLDKYSTLQSIGEETEENDDDDEHDDDDVDHHKKTDPNRLSGSDEDRPIPLGRRWSDGVVSDDDGQSRTSSQPRPLTKMSSVTSIMKTEPTIKTPVKISKTKYLLMKLHLTPSTNKSEETARKAERRTVRRSSDKKRYQTR